ncbi:hypothetical protein BDR22DRAFT_885754 [Usnea florida]
MPFYLRSLSILIFVSNQVLLSIASVACYNPDQTVPSPPYVPCDTATGVHSACCTAGDACTSNGYCLGPVGYPYRGGCTDITWNSPNCCPGCRNTDIDSFCNVYACPSTVNGHATRTWCCGTDGDGAGVGCCNGSTVFYPDFGSGPLVLALANTTNPNPSTLATSSSLLTTSSSFVISSIALTASEPVTEPNPSTLPPSSPHFTTSPSPVVSTTSLIASEPAPTPTKTPVEPSFNPSEPSRNSVTLGTGIGVPVGALLLSSLVFLFLRERRLRIRAQKMTDPFRAAQGIETTGGQSYEIQGPSLPQDLDHVEHRPEILSQEVYEANGGF